MGSSSNYGASSEMMSLLENSNNSIWAPSSSSNPFHESMMNFDHERHQVRRATAKRVHNSGRDDGDDNDGGEELDINPYYHQAEKKRRLTPQQVEFLEKSFEMENKLEPERKVELAKELGLQPRQVAIWFQNRRARYKTKQLEKDYDSLKSNYDRLKLDFDSLSKEKHDLQNQIKVLTKKLKQRDEEKEYIATAMPKWETQMLEKPGLMVVSSVNKQLLEDANSAKSDIVDSESPHYTDAHHSSLMDDPTDQQSDYSHCEEEHLMLPAPAAPSSVLAYNNLLKVEDEGCYDDPNASSCNFSLVDDQPFLSWLC